MRFLATASAGALALALAACSPGGQQQNTAAEDPNAQRDATAANPGPQNTADTPNSATGAPGQVLPAAEFVRMAAMSDLFEIESSRLALEKSPPQPVRAYAQQMIDHHTEMSRQMRTAVNTSGVTAPAPTALEGEKATQVSEMRGLSGEQFQTRYLQAQVQSHEQALAMFEAYASGGDQPAIKAVAAQAVPRIRQHLEEARALQSAGGATAAPAKS